MAPMYRDPIEEDDRDLVDDDDAERCHHGVSFDEDCEDCEFERDAGLKWCRLCRAWHARAAFAADRSRGDGLASACRESRNARKRALYAVRSAPASTEVVA